MTDASPAPSSGEDASASGEDASGEETESARDAERIRERREIRRAAAEVGTPGAALRRARQERVPLPDALLRRVKQFSSRLSTEALTQMEGQLLSLIHI